MKDYFTKLFLTLLIVAVAFGILIGLNALFDFWGVICGFVAFMGLGIWAYNYSNKKERESCPNYKKN